MWVYRAELPAGARVVAVSAHPVRPAPGLGAGGPKGACRVTVRYATPDGRVAARRGLLRGVLAMSTAPVVAGYHMDGPAVVVTLRPGQAGALRAGRGAALSDRFRLPVALHAWGVTAVSGADMRVDAVCRLSGGALLVRGAVRLRLEAPAAAFDLRTPFVRLLAAPEGAGPGLRWRVRAGVVGLQVRVEPGGRVQGEVEVALRAEGRPPAVGQTAGVQAVEVLALVREVLGEVGSLVAELAGPGCAVLRGVLSLDVYGIDREGASRWTGRSLPFSTLAELPGAAPGDRLELSARLEGLSHTNGEVRAVVALSVTALRPVIVTGADGTRYRVEQVAALAATTVTLAEPLWAGASVAGRRPGEEVAARQLPLAGPAAWSDLAVVLSSPGTRDGARDGGRDGAGRWRVYGAVGGTPLDEAPYPAPLRAWTGGSVALEAQDSLVAVPALERVEGAGLWVRTALLWGPVLPEAATLPASVARVEGDIAVPGPVRRLLSLAVSARAGGGFGVVVLAVLEGGRGVVLVEGTVADGGTGSPGGAGSAGGVQMAGGTGRPMGAQAYPEVRNGQWRLRVTVFCDGGDR